MINHRSFATCCLLLRGLLAQVLLVEPCDMVRQVLMLALRAWGSSVCAVKTEEEAISHLNLRSAFLTSYSLPQKGDLVLLSTHQMQPSRVGQARGSGKVEQLRGLSASCYCCYGDTSMTPGLGAFISSL